MEQETIHYHRWFVALTKGQGIHDYINTPLEQYDGIACVIPTALAEG